MGKSSHDTRNTPVKESDSNITRGPQPKPTPQTPPKPVKW